MLVISVNMIIHHEPERYNQLSNHLMMNDEDDGGRLFVKEI